MAPTLTEELASAAARLVVEEGMEYGPAKRRAARVLGRHSVRPAELPSNDAVEEEVRAYLELFCADTQPAELDALRRLALDWMERLAEFRPHLTGAVWRGTATRLSNLHLDLYCDDAKAAEIGLLNRGIDFDVDSRTRPGGGEPIEVLVIAAPCRALNEEVTLFLHVRDLDELRGALKPDAGGRTLRGDAGALRRLLQETP
ncbi:hypothetical protein [Ideonella sp. BN130291]|uniref:hypothetical protein n=1 Tax=Ideonella sp. BN130291 TaxID=3112940 RepID=UPI002E25F1E5|nr:hypothetical protein [Ideonella sp. BN130291]